MPHPFLKLYTPAFAMLCATAACFAAPMIAVDSPNVNLGVIMEGKVSSVKYTFKIKNTGDSVLRILSVKPG